jgi:hypothetical protein
MKLSCLQENGNHHVKQNKTDWERQIPHILSYVESRPGGEKNEWYLCKTRDCLRMGTSGRGEKEVNMLEVIHVWKQNNDTC